MRRLGLVVLCAAGLWAQPTFAGDAAAEALFRAGREAFEQGDYRTACARFEESQRLEPAVGTVLNLAQCHESLGQVASAWRRYREARDRLSSSDERLAWVEERIRAVEGRLPKLTLRLEQPVPDARVTRDGVELGAASLGVAVPVDPGDHELVVNAPNHEPRRVTVSLREGENKEVVLDVGARRADPAGRASASAASPPPDPPSGGSSKTAGYVVGGVGLGALAASLVTGALVLDRKQTVEDECDGKLCTREGVDAGESGRTLSTVSTIAFVAGVAGVGLGTYLLLSSGPDRREQARLELRAVPGAAALRFQTRF